MTRIIRSSFAALALIALSAVPAAAQGKDIVETAVAAGSFKTLAAALQAAGLVETLKGQGPFTVFAPTDEAFAKLPAGTVDNLLKPENKAKLVALLTYHVVAGKVSASDLIGKINASGGAATLTTVQGGTLTAKIMGGKVVIVDAKGGAATVTAADMMQSNGIIHVTDAVSIPG